MSRSGYSYDCENWSLICWRGAVASAIRGRRGQQTLKELASAMDAMPVKELISDELEAEGAFCTLGVLGSARGIDMKGIDPYDRESVSHKFNIAEALAAEIMYENDECVTDHEYRQFEICGPMRPHYPDYGSHMVSVKVAKENPRADRWKRMRDWVATNLKEGS